MRLMPWLCMWAGSIDGFAQMMNDKAKELGCVDSHFTNPHGLPDENHVSSAYDMALITRAALSYDVFREIASTTYYEIPATELQKDQIPMSNHHKMLTAGKYHYEGAFCRKDRLYHGGAEYPCDLCPKGRYGADLCYHENSRKAGLCGYGFLI